MGDARGFSLCVWLMYKGGRQGRLSAGCPSLLGSHSPFCFPSLSPCSFLSLPKKWQGSLECPTGISWPRLTGVSFRVLCPCFYKYSLEYRPVKLSRGHCDLVATRKFTELSVKHLLPKQWFPVGQFLESSRIFSVAKRTDCY